MHIVRPRHSTPPQREQFLLPPSLQCSLRVHVNFRLDSKWCVIYKNLSSSFGRRNLRGHKVYLILGSSYFGNTSLHMKFHDSKQNYSMRKVSICKSDVICQSHGFIHMLEEHRYMLEEPGYMLLVAPIFCLQSPSLDQNHNHPSTILECWCCICIDTEISNTDQY